MAGAMLKVTDPNKIVTDTLMLKRLAEQGIDKDYVELSQDYAPRSLGKGHSPYAKFYRDLKSNKRFMIVSGLPMVDHEGNKIEIGWQKLGDRYESKRNLFTAIVDKGKITVTCLNDQPNGRKKGDWLEWRPQLYLNNIEQTCGKVVLLPVDPVNSNLQENTLEWDYGICKRRIRLIQGRIREKWLFESNPNGEVKIEHNHTGTMKLRLGEYAVGDDTEIAPPSAFNEAEYPFEVMASPETFYPDTGPQGVDGEVSETNETGTWHSLVTSPGDSSGAASTEIGIILQGYTSSNKWKNLVRDILVFDTSGLPDDATVTGATFSLYGKRKRDNLSTSPDINVYKSTPFSNIALQNDDFVDIGTVALSNVITYGDFDVTGYNDFALTDVDTDDFGYVSRTSVTKLGARNANFDVADELDPNNHDPNWSSTNSYLFAYSSDYGSDKPKLVVTYTAGEDFVKNLSDTFSMSDSINKAVGSFKSDSVAIADSILKRPSIYQADNFSLSDTIVKTVDLAKTETLVMADSFSSQADFVRAFDDSISMADSLGKVTSKPISDSISIADDIVKGMAIAKSDTLTIADSISKAMGLVKSESFSITDVIFKVVGIVEAETMAIADSFSRTVSYIRAFSDNSSLSDSINKVIGLVKSENMTIADTFSRRVDYKRSLSDTFSITDTFSRTVAYLRSFFDTLSISDSRGGISYIFYLLDTMIISDTMTGIHRVKAFLTQKVSRMPIVRMGVARMDTMRMRVSRMPLYRWVIRRFP